MTTRENGLEAQSYENGKLPTVPNRVVHPLLLDVVLNNVFQTLDSEILVTCRLVCKTWLHNPVLQANIKQKSTIFLRWIFLHTATTKETLPDYFQLSAPIYENFHFTRISYQNELVFHFFHIMGPTVKKLKLHLDLNQLNLQQFRDLIYERVPNLVELNIYNLSHEEVFLKKLFPPMGPLPELKRPKHANIKYLEMQEIRSPISGFMGQFLGTLINLREIILKADVCSDWIEQADLWRQNSAIATSIIKGLEASGAYKTLKVFRGGKLRSGHLESFVNMGNNGMQLEALEFHAPSKNGESLFNTFLDTQKHSLKQLIIFEQRGARYSKSNEHQAFHLRIPEKMFKLELLQMCKFQKSRIVSMFPVDVTKQCPGLKELHGVSLYIPSEKCTSLQTLTLWRKQARDSNIAHIVGSSFPNLTKLIVKFPSQEFLTALWSACNKLQYISLHLGEKEYMDEGMTGLPTSIISRWLKSTEQNYREVAEWVECNEYQQIEKSIRNLKQLKTLKIIVDHDDSCDRQSLCDATAYFALKEMPHLRYVELFSSHWHMGLTFCQFFSQEYCHLLRTHLDLTIIHFSPFEGA